MHQINREIHVTASAEPEAPVVSLPVIIPTDGELLLRFTRGEQAAFAELVERHRRVVWLACWQVLRHRQDVEDAFQATFLILARKASSLRSIDSLAAWLHRVAYRASIRMLRNRKREPAAHLSTEVEMAEDKLLQIQRREESSILLEELRALPDKYQIPLILCQLEGRSRSAAAEELGCTTAAIKGRLARGKSMLRIRLARRGVGLSVAMAALAAPLRQAEASITDSLAAAIVDGCQTVHFGQPAPEGLSTQAVTLSQQTLLHEGLLTMTAATFAKPICIGVTLLGLATVAVAEAKKDADSTTAVVASSDTAGFDLTAAVEPPAATVDVEIVAEKHITASSTQESTKHRRPSRPVVAELPELPELGVDLPDLIVADLELQVQTDATAPALAGTTVRTLSAAKDQPSIVQSRAKTVRVAVPNLQLAQKDRIEALKDARESLQLKSQGLLLQSEAKAARAKAMQTGNREQRERMLNEAEILELKAESLLLKAEALSTKSEAAEIERQIESFSNQPQSALPVVPPVPPVPISVTQSIPRAVAVVPPGVSQKHYIMPRQSDEDVAKNHWIEESSELQQQKAELHALREVIEQQRKKQSRAVEQIKKAHAEQREAVKQAEMQLKQQMEKLERQRRELSRRREELEAEETIRPES